MDVLSETPPADAPASSREDKDDNGSSSVSLALRRSRRQRASTVSDHASPDPLSSHSRKRKPQSNGVSVGHATGYKSVKRCKEEQEQETSSGAPSSQSQHRELERDLCERLLEAHAAGMVQPVRLSCEGVGGQLLGGHTTQSIFVQCCCHSCAAHPPEEAVMDLSDFQSHCSGDPMSPSPPMGSILTAIQVDIADSVRGLSQVTLADYAKLWAGECGGKALVGEGLFVYWCAGRPKLGRGRRGSGPTSAPSAWQQAVVVDFNAASGEHKVKYTEDGAEMWSLLACNFVHFGPHPPGPGQRATHLPELTAAAAAAAAASTGQ